MKSLKNYWFLQEPIDVEHKFYVLMDFLQSVEEDINHEKYNEPIQKVRRIYEDLKSFKDNHDLSTKTLATMPPSDLDVLKEIQRNTENRADEIENLIDNSLTVMDGFMTKINPIIEKINESISVYEMDGVKDFKDQGFMVLRQHKSKKIKVYSWMFSFVQVKKKDQIGILITELLDPLPKFSKVDKKIVSFFRDEIKVSNPVTDAFVFVDMDGNKKDLDISFDLMKDKGVKFIVDSYRGFFS
jgi:hypothetical protein